MKIILSIVFLSCAFTAYAEGFFIGGAVGIVIYPNYTTDTSNWLIDAGASYASVKQNKGSFTLDFHGGQWVNKSLGWEAGYTDLGSVDGSYTSNLTFPGANGTYKYSASASHLAALGGTPLGLGRLFGKIGLFSASTHLSDPFGSQNESSTGLLLGGGYELSLTPNLAGRAGINLFNGVKFINEGT
jgi:opacity protein-like surface antigen